MSTIRLNAVGDIWFGDHPVRIGHGVSSRYSPGNEGALFEETRHLFADADLNFCNLESVLSDAGRRAWSLPSLEMRGRPSAASALTEAGFNVISMANNHMMQHGEQCYIETAQRLRQLGATVIGLENERGESQVETLEVRGMRVGCIAFSLRPEEYFKGRPLYAQRDSFEDVLSEVTRAAAAGYDFLLCSLHWGTEFMLVPEPRQIEFARRLIDAGVDVVLGHHPHVLQGWEHYGKGLVLYSLGNFVFDLWPRDTRKSIVAHITLQKGRAPGMAVTPIWIDDAYRPTVAVGELAEEIQQEVRSLAGRIASRELFEPEEYRRRSRAAEREIRLSGYRYFARNLHRYPVNMLVQSVGRTILRRLSGN
jgi:poly-gamma-glutamate synthesis protein (capsule biosynthesis protein)